MAASGFAAGVGYGMGQQLATTDMSPLAQKMLRGAVAGTVGTVVRGGRLSLAQLATDAFGQVNAADFARQSLALGGSGGHAESQSAFRASERQYREDIQTFLDLNQSLRTRTLVDLQQNGIVTERDTPKVTAAYLRLGMDDQAVRAAYGVPELDQPVEPMYFGPRLAVSAKNASRAEALRKQAAVADKDAGVLADAFAQMRAQGKADAANAYLAEVIKKQNEAFQARQKADELSPNPAESFEPIKPNFSVRPGWNYMGMSSARIPTGSAIGSFSGTVGGGYYAGIGGELELEFSSGEIVGGKAGLGVGYGAHLTRSSASGAFMQGPVYGYKSTPIAEYNPQQEGTVRFGPSVTAGGGVGVLGTELSLGFGVDRNGTGSRGYAQGAWNWTSTPAIPKLGFELKANLIEFSVKPQQPGSR